MPFSFILRSVRKKQPLRFGHLYIGFIFSNTKKDNSVSCPSLISLYILSQPYSLLSQQLVKLSQLWIKGKPYFEWLIRTVLMLNVPSSLFMAERERRKEGGWRREGEREGGRGEGGRRREGRRAPAGGGRQPWELFYDLGDVSPEILSVPAKHKA